ncbi:right-handed parallel beta-helix repeat-containing protein [Streptomyces regalis]|uniref:Uncharacterized protein n=1 Tax=Streptomyces regalis TaxID=68262 RepID=A0A101JSA6_9ACTN|nr:right-handed parallel beta-helix repeat-containing protein [Streptomyces regalis]KUL32150.1 hypothetical protein ADL12_23415 [Streptomyces regalis]
MRKRLTGALAVAAAAAVTAGMPVAAAGGQKQAEIVVYVAADGSADASGTRGDPLATVEQARDALAGRTSKSHRGRVWIRGGTYEVSESVALSGEENSHVTYAAYRGEDVEFTGVTTLPADRFVPLAEVLGDDSRFSSRSRVPKEVADQVYVYDLGAESVPTGQMNKNGFNWKPQPYAPQLLTDNVVQTLAQYPNSGHLGREALSVRNGGESARNHFSDKSKDGTTLPYEEMLRLRGPAFSVQGSGVRERCASWAPPYDPSGGGEADNTAYETDGWLTGYFGFNWADDRVRIASTSPEGLNDEGEADGWHIRTAYPSMYGASTHALSLVAQNILGELDAEGEYYIDRFEGNDVLYYYPPGGTVEGRDISLSSLDQPFFTLENVTGVTIKGLGMNGSTSNGIRMLDCESCTVNGVEIRNVSLDAITIGEATDTITAVTEYKTSRGGHHNRVINSVLHDLGSGGVFLAGGDRETLERGNNLVAHNEIYDFSKQATTYTPAGYLYGVGNTFRHNHVHDAPHMAIQIMGNDMRVVHNRFETLVTGSGDMGAIYSGRDFTYLNNEIAYNYFRDIGRANDTHAVYMDDGMSGMIIHHNVFDTGQDALYFNSGRANVASDNVFLDVEKMGHDWLYHHHNKQLPVPNAKVIIERLYDMLRVGDGSGFTNTEQNVRRWYEHYEDLYPSLKDWYVPVDAAGKPCTAVGTDECTSSYVWKDPNSLYVPSNSVLTRSVRINTGEFYHTKDPSIATFNPDWDSYNVSGDEPADFAFDPETGRFDADTTSLNETDGFGSAWVEEWNSNVGLAGIGPR